jgi:hypothetical protein
MAPICSCITPCSLTQTAYAAHRAKRLGCLLPPIHGMIHRAFARVPEEPWVSVDTVRHLGTHRSSFRAARAHPHNGAPSGHHRKIHGGYMAQKIAYVTGGMGGIGTAICQRLHTDGFKVIAGCGPTRDHGKWLTEQQAAGYTFYASVGNVGEWESTVDAFKAVKADHGPVDVLVNNAGITRDGLFRKMIRADWDAVINTNLNSLFNE